MNDKKAKSKRITAYILMGVGYSVGLLVSLYYCFLARDWFSQPDGYHTYFTKVVLPTLRNPFCLAGTIIMFVGVGVLLVTQKSNKSE